MGGNGVNGAYLFVLVYCHNLINFATMPRTKNHDEIDKLPSNALTVAKYAESINKHQSVIYHWINRGKANYTIKVFQGINFVIPNK